MHAIAKIIARHAGKSGAEVGEILHVAADYMMLNDRGAARARTLMKEMGADRVHDPDKVVVVFDHHYPAIRLPDAEAQKKTREWVKEQGIPHFYAGEGIGHVIFPERGFVFPGAIIFGTDSHTVTNSALGCLATGLGHSDVASFLALGHNWLKVPQTVRFDLHGTLKPWVSAKDITLHILQMFGEDAANYQTVEFAGPAISSMTMEDRLTLCNMTIDFGAKTGYVQPDEVTFRYLEGRVPQSRWFIAETDSEADYVQIVDIDLGKVESLVAIPHNLSVIKNASDVHDVTIEEVIFGTCTGGRLSDFRVAAQILKGRKLAPHTRMMVNPGSRDVYLQAMREGLIDIMVEAGVTLGVPGCGPCSGCHQGMLAAGERAISTASRNFRGRNGSPDSEVYVASPATAAASAVAGRIVSPQEIASMMEDH